MDPETVVFLVWVGCCLLIGIIGEIWKHTAVKRKPGETDEEYVRRNWFTYRAGMAALTGRDIGRCTDEKVKKWVGGKK